MFSVRCPFVLFCPFLPSFFFVFIARNYKKVYFCKQNQLINNMHQSLLFYFSTRGIVSPEVQAYPFLSEFWQYSHPHIAWRNRSGGYELRNANFKGCKGTKDISICPGFHSHHTFILEGFFDTLTLFEMWRIWYQNLYGFYPHYFPNVICLNSAALVGRAVDYINKLGFISRCSFILDNDEASKKAFCQMKSGLKCCSMRAVVVPNEKDINALWTSNKKESRIVLDGFINYLFEGTL